MTLASVSLLFLRGLSQCLNSPKTGYVVAMGFLTAVEEGNCVLPRVSACLSQNCLKRFDKSCILV